MDESLNKPHECKIEINPAETAKPSQIQEESFFDKNKAIKIAIMLAIIIFACGYIRFYDASMPALDKAANMDITYLTIEKIKEKMYNPLADPKELQREMETTIKQIYNSKEFKIAVNERANAYKRLYYDSAGDPYLVKADPYYYLRQARNIIEGNPSEKTLFPYLVAYAYKLSPYSLIKTAYYLPLVFGVLSCIIAFFLTAKISDYWGGFIAGFILAVHPIFIDATMLGDADTQIMNTFFSLLIAYFFVLLLKSDKNIFRGIYACLLLITVYLFKLTWGTYYYILFILAASLIAYAVLTQFKTKSKIKRVIIPGILGLAILAGLFMIFSTKLSRILQELGLISTQAAPDSLSYIQELKALSLTSFIARADILIVLIAIVSAGYIAYRLIKKPEATNTFILTWFASLLIVSFLAVRLLMFLILPLSIIAGYGISKTYPYLAKFPRSVHLKMPRKIFEPILAVVLILVISISVQAQIKEMTSGIAYRLMDDSIEKITKTILTKTKSNAVINDWWDLGHIYKYYTRRNAIADGANPNDPSVPWFAKALVSANETEAVDILHMIDCGKEYNTDIVSTNCSVTEGIVIVSDYIIKKHPIILKTAEWDFKLAEIYPEIKDLSSEEAIEKIKQKYPESDADEIYGHTTQYSDAQPDPKVTIPTQECARKENTIVCGDYSFDTILNRVYYGTTAEYSFAYVNETGIMRKDAGTAKTVIIYMEDQRIRYAVVDSDFMESLLVKLYFFEARGMTHFELLDKASFAYARKIKAFTVRWDSIGETLNNTAINKEI